MSTKKKHEKALQKCGGIVDVRMVYCVVSCPLLCGLLGITIACACKTSRIFKATTPARTRTPCFVPPPLPRCNPFPFVFNKNCG